MPLKPKNTADQFSRDWRKIEPALIKKIEEYYNQGFSVSSAVNKAFDDLEIELFITDNVMTLVNVQVASSGIEIVKQKEFRKWFLNKTWPDEKFSLSQTIAKKKYREVIKKEIKGQLKQGSTWIKLSRSLSDKELVKGVLPEYINDVLKTAKRAGLSPKELKAYRAAVKRAERNINRLALNGAPNKALKKAYTKILEATKTGNEQAISNSIARGVSEKARANAERIGRTEIVRANTLAEQQIIDEDEDVVAWRSVLNSRHVITDICDFYANADLYGLGPGIYPKAVRIPIPYHPNCFCLIEYIYRKDVTRVTIDNKQAQKWLKEHLTLRSKMMNKEGEKKFLKDPTTWKRHLRGWEPMQTKMPKIPKSVQK
jgi:hypothetical protein